MLIAVCFTLVQLLRTCVQCDSAIDRLASGTIIRKSETDDFIEFPFQREKCVDFLRNNTVCNSIIHAVAAAGSLADVVDFFVAFEYDPSKDFSVFSFTYSGEGDGWITSMRPDLARGSGRWKVYLLAFFDQSSSHVRELLMAHIMMKHNLFGTDVGANAMSVFFPELNAPVYHGFFLLGLSAFASADVERFDLFKSKNHTNRFLWRVFYEYWERNTHLPGKVCSVLFQKFPHLFDFLPVLAALDRSIGNPDTVVYDMCSAVIHEPDKFTFTQRHRAILMKYGCITGFNQHKSVAARTISVSKVQTRYLVEVALLEDAFGPLDGMHVLEVGGGFGGMAATVQAVYDIEAYSIVDLAPAGRLQTRYLSTLSARLARDSGMQSLRPAMSLAARGQELIFRADIIDAVRSSNVTSDITISFFAIAEQKTSEVDRYLVQYAANSPRGYFQLNYDQPDYDCKENRLSSMYSAIELFRAVYAVQPTAVLLPGLDMYEYPGTHHRIIWGSIKYGASDTFLT